MTEKDEDMVKKHEEAYKVIEGQIVKLKQELDEKEIIINERKDEQYILQSLTKRRNVNQRAIWK